MMDVKKRIFQILMNKSLYILIMCLSVSCKKTTKIQPQISVVDSIQNISERSTNEISKEYREQNLFLPDTSVNQFLKLGDNQGLKNLITQSNKDKISYIDYIRETPVFLLQNDAGTQYMLIYHYEGDTEYTISCFEIGFWKDSDFGKYEFVRVNRDIFKTESGIQLGLTLEKLIDIKGKNYKIEKLGPDSIFTYVNNNEQDNFLKRYRMPGYFMKYKIKNNIIHEILFGFEYP